MRASLLKPRGRLGRYEWRLFVPDPDRPGTLHVPAFAPVQSTTTWPIGVGVTGVAYQSGQGELGVGEGLAETYPVSPGLVDPERAARHARLKVVAAMPVQSALSTTLGVLTASSEARSLYITTPAGQRDHARLADAVARVLIDLLGFDE